MNFKGIAGVVAGLTLGNSAMSHALPSPARIVPDNLRQSVEQQEPRIVPSGYLPVNYEPKFLFFYLDRDHDGIVDLQIVLMPCGMRPIYENPHIIYDAFARKIISNVSLVGVPNDSSLNDHLLAFISRSSCKQE